MNNRFMMRCMTLTAYIPKHSTTVVSYQANWQSNDADELHKLIVTRCHGFQRKQTIATHKSSVRAIIMLASSARNYKKFLYSLSLYLEAALVAAFGERLINSLHAHDYSLWLHFGFIHKNRCGSIQAKHEWILLRIHRNICSVFEPVCCHYAFMADLFRRLRWKVLSPSILRKLLEILITVSCSRWE